MNIELSGLNEQLKNTYNSVSRIRELHQQLEKTQKEIAQYIEIANAFGQNGIQDIIIENSLPEIEFDTNELLLKFTNNKFKIALKTSKSEPKSIIKDTLNVVIYDNLRARSYDTFSGGELFIINLSLRIAISKLLARSRQTKLQTFIIDDALNYQYDRISMKQIVSTLSEEFGLLLLVSNDKVVTESIKRKIEFTKQSEDTAGSIVA